MLVTVSPLTQLVKSAVACVAPVNEHLKEIDWEIILSLQYHFNKLTISIYTTALCSHTGQLLLQGLLFTYV